MVDFRDDGSEKRINSHKIPDRKVAVAVADTGGGAGGDLPHVTAAGRGALADQIIQLAFDHGVRVREDSALAQMLATVELDTPIPSDAFIAVSEILSYVYKANNAPNPFDFVGENN